ncbi:hypothetical protein V5799_021179 [Amblyomma americanum]|uniref:Uncharacterized protein n=1 Tax=Amblyomma americanum TaxID=6943 RepID=A0AAQ4FR37_AMBAM
MTPQQVTAGTDVVWRSTRVPRRPRRGRPRLVICISTRGSDCRFNGFACGVWWRRLFLRFHGVALQHPRISGCNRTGTRCWFFGGSRRQSVNEPLEAVPGTERTSLWWRRGKARAALEALVAMATAVTSNSGGGGRGCRRRAMDAYGAGGRESAVSLTCPACRISAVSSRARAMCPFCGSFYNRDANSNTSLRRRTAPGDSLPHIFKLLAYQKELLDLCELNILVLDGLAFTVRKRCRDAANNKKNPNILTYTEFYNSALDHIDLMSEYYRWQSPGKHTKRLWDDAPRSLALSGHGGVVGTKFAAAFQKGDLVDTSHEPSPSGVGTAKEGEEVRGGQLQAVYLKGRPADLTSVLPPCDLDSFKKDEVLGTELRAIFRKGHHVDASCALLPSGSGGVKDGVLGGELPAILQKGHHVDASRALPPSGSGGVKDRVLGGELPAILQKGHHVDASRALPPSGSGGVKDESTWRRAPSHPPEGSPC